MLGKWLGLENRGEVMAGCLGLFIFIGIIGAIGSTFGGEWAALVVCILICLGFWANNEEQKEKEEQTTKLPINKSTDITIYNANKRTVEYKVATSKPPITPPRPQIYSDSSTKSPKNQFRKSSNKISFLYEDSKGNLTHREVRVDDVDNTYINGFCYSANGTRTFKLERIIGSIKQNGESYPVEEWLEKQGISNYIDNESDYGRNFEICFTGFRKDIRERLERKAKENDFIVRKSITQNLDFLVTGSNAGPSKVRQAISQGVTILDEDEFNEMMETGALPD
ncbi:hypothetical protein GHJ37_01065 [Glaesserella parasuis]|nr:hypothetical protein [Glaesserella parasuis]